MHLDPLTAPGDPGLTAAVITSEHGFPHTVLHERHHELLAKVLAARPYPAEIKAALNGLAEEIEGPILPLSDSAPSAAVWAAWAAPYLGRTWYEVPFLWAENFFYRKLLEATGWFGPGPWQGIDPFGPQKDAELSGPAVAAELEALNRLGELSVDDLLLAALWGNRADLGFKIKKPTEDGENPSTNNNLIADDRAVLLPLLNQSDKVIVVTDNVGRELLPDLILADRLLTNRPAASVALHVKPSPYFTSDATPADVLKTVQRLLEGPPAAVEVGNRLTGHLTAGRLQMVTNDFYVAPLTFAQAPAEIRDLYAEADLTLLKGDLNYRRLVGDAAWPATTPFETVTSYWPGRVAALRTLKSDVLVGMQAERLAWLDATGQNWRTSGDCAVVQLR